MPLASAGVKRAAENRLPSVPNKQRRQSLPYSIPSSTVATKSKVERRRSLRRQSIRNSTSKENTNPHYSPPETRSAKKKKLHDKFVGGEGGCALQFSPPDQQLNAKREQEELERKQNER